MMKRVRAIAVALLLTVVMLIPTGCGSLATPVGLTIDENYLLTWDEVPGARSYRIEIVPEGGKAEELPARVARQDLSDLEEGDYTVRVKAVGGSRSGAVSSGWSKSLSFNRDRETGLVFELINNNTEYQVARVGRAPSEVVIPDLYRGKPVTAIADRAFYSSGRVERVTVGANVRTIGNSAFQSCYSLVSITIPETVMSIGESVFQSCSLLSEVRLPTSVDGDASTLPASITEIPAYAFAYCYSLGKFKIGEGVTSIGEGAFYRCEELVEIDIPDGVITVGNRAFNSAQKLEKVTFGKGITFIGDESFAYCSALKDVGFSDLDGNLEVGGGAFLQCNELEHIELPVGTVTIGKQAFSMCDKFVDITIPDTVSKIGLGAFGATALYKQQTEEGIIYAGNEKGARWIVQATPELKETITRIVPDETGSSTEENRYAIKENTKGIAEQAFAECAVLARVELPASVKYIGNMAFYNCEKLTLFAFPENGVQIIENGAFSYNTVLSRVVLRSGLESIGAYAFEECPQITQIEIPDTVTKIGRKAFYTNQDTLEDRGGIWATWDEYGVIYAGNWVVGFYYDEVENEMTHEVTTESHLAGNVQLRSDVVGIADYAFYKGTVMQNLIGFQNVRYVGEGAFYCCEDLASISLYPALEEIKPGVFYKCYSLFQISIPPTVKELGAYSFYACGRLNTIDFSATKVESVGAYSFYQCSSLQQFIPSEQLTTIEPYAFYGTSITDISLPNVTAIGSRAFAHNTALQNIRFGDSLEYIGTLAFRECTGLQEVILPDSLKVIDHYAFINCINLKRIEFGNGLEYIGGLAFYNDISLASLVLPASLKEISDYAFYRCSGLESVVFCGDIDYVGVEIFMGSSPAFYFVEHRNSRWNGGWNAAYRPIINGVTLSEEGYVDSLTVGEDTFEYARIWGGIPAPYRMGWEFVGWAETPGGEVVYSMQTLVTDALGKTVYAVWEESSEPNPEPEIPEDETPQDPAQNADNAA